MAKIHITQLLCSQRHCILAAAWDEGKGTRQKAETAIKETLEGIGNSWCGICGSTALHFEDGVTEFNSMEEALPSIREEQLKNMIARAALARDPKRN